MLRHERAAHQLGAQPNDLVHLGDGCELVAEFHLHPHCVRWRMAPQGELVHCGVNAGCMQNMHLCRVRETIL